MGRNTPHAARGVPAHGPLAPGSAVAVCGLYARQHGRRGPRALGDRVSTAYMLSDDGIATPMVAPAGATLEQELEAARRALAHWTAKEKELDAAFGYAQLHAETPEVEAARAARSQARQEVGDMGRMVRTLEAQVEQAYDREQRINADGVLTAAAQFDAALRMLLAAMRDANAAGLTMYK